LILAAADDCVTAVALEVSDIAEVERDVVRLWVHRGAVHFRGRQYPRGQLDDSEGHIVNGRRLASIKEEMCKREN